jgi:hypothetical protein
MRKANLAVLCIVAVAIFAMAGSADAGIVDPCFSYWELHAVVTPCPLFVCPLGDTDAVIDQGWWIWICVLDLNGLPLENVPFFDFWMIDCDPINDATLCAGSASSNADSNTNAAGMTTISQTTVAAGGCSDGMAVVVQGFVIEDSLTNCTTVFCCPINLRSPDINGDLIVNLQDLALFAASYPPQPFDTCCDFDLNGIVNLQDLANFAFHFGPPGHACQ